MKVIVCGGRDFENAAFVFVTLSAFHRETPIMALMQGGARGADTLARDWARATRGVESWVCKADWAKHGKAAGPKRNARMLEWGPDVVIAFPGGVGTDDMVVRARAMGVRVIEAGRLDSTCGTPPSRVDSCPK